MLELADKHVSEACAERRTGSIPVSRTNKELRSCENYKFSQLFLRSLLWYVRNQFVNNKPSKFYSFYNKNVIIKTKAKQTF